MDTLLLRSYRVCWSDFLILYDALIVYNQRRPTGKSWKELGKGLHTLLKEEANTSEGSTLVEDEDSIDFSEETVVQKVLWQFTHGVALEFLVEELSQYPFWAAKVVAVVDRTYTQNINVLTSALNFFKNTYERGGIRAIFEGNVPFLAAAVVLNFEHLQKSAKGFFSILESRLPTRPSHGNKMNQQTTKTPKRRRSNDMDTSSKKNTAGTAAAGASNWSMASIAGRVVVAGLSHPLLLLSVRMLTSPELQSQNWLSAYLSLVTTQGIPVMYTGLRISLSLALLPIAPLYSFGVPETVTYRRMSGQGEDDRLGGSFSVIYNALVEEGALGLMGYGLLTAVQVVPGFFTFIASKWLLWLVCGTSRQRSRQFRRRKMILETQCWPKYLIDGN